MNKMSGRSFAFFNGHQLFIQLQLLAIVLKSMFLMWQFLSFPVNFLDGWPSLNFDYLLVISLKFLTSFFLLKTQDHRNHGIERNYLWLLKKNSVSSWNIFISLVTLVLVFGNYCTKWIWSVCSSGAVALNVGISPQPWTFGNLQDHGSYVIIHYLLSSVKTTKRLHLLISILLQLIPLQFHSDETKIYFFGNALAWILD